MVCVIIHVNVEALLLPRLYVRAIQTLPTSTPVVRSPPAIPIAQMRMRAAQHYGSEPNAPVRLRVGVVAAAHRIACTRCAPRASKKSPPEPLHSGRFG